MNKKIFYALLCSTLTIMKCFSFGIQFTTLYHPHNNTVISLVGDWHSITPEELHKEQLFDKAFFCTELKKLLNKGYKIIFEGSPENMEHIATVNSLRPSYGLRRVRLNAITNKNDYIPSDIRTNTVECLSKIYLHGNSLLEHSVINLKEKLNNKFYSSKNLNTRFLLKNALEFCDSHDDLTIINTYLYQTHSYITTEEVLDCTRKYLYYPHTIKTPITIASLELAFIKNSATIFHSFTGLKQKKPEYMNLIQHLHYKLFELYKQGIAYFADLKNRFPENTEFATLLFELGKASKNIAYGCGVTENNPFSDFYMKLTADYPDIYFITQALKHDHALIFAGDIHCANIITTLLNSGFIQNYHVAIDTNKPYQPQETTNFLKNIESFI